MHRSGRYNRVMKRLYWTQPDTLEMDVDVVSVDEQAVTTDPILFHPDEGGQPADLGTIGPASVINVEVLDGRVVHRLDRPVASGRYFARVDRQRRIHTAGHHTAQHIISGLAERRFGLQTTSVHIGLERCTVDFDQKVDWDILTGLEHDVMDVIRLNVPVETTFDEAQVRTREDLKPIAGDVIRVVKIGAYDASACCGAHVGSTGQIGLVRLCDMDSKKQGVRIFFLAGAAALEYTQAETSVLRELRKVASCSTAELPVLYEKALAQAKELAKQIDGLWAQRLPDLAAAAEVVEVDSSRVGIQVTEFPVSLAGKLAGMIANRAGAGIAISGTRIAINATTLDAGALLKRIQAATGGKGGGSPHAANGSLGRAVTAGELVTILKAT